MLKSPPLVATLSDSMRMSPCSWGDIFTWPLRGDRIIGLRHYIPALYINDPQTATIARSPGRASDAKQRHSNASRHGEKTLPHWRGQPPRGSKTLLAALLGNRISHARAGQKLQRTSPLPPG